jgi:hypothetical protein
VSAAHRTAPQPDAAPALAAFRRVAGRVAPVLTRLVAEVDAGAFDAATALDGLDRCLALATRADLDAARTTARELAAQAVAHAAATPLPLARQIAQAQSLPRREQVEAFGALHDALETSDPAEDARRAAIHDDADRAAPLLTDAALLDAAAATLVAEWHAAVLAWARRRLADAEARATTRRTRLLAAVMAPDPPPRPDPSTLVEWPAFPGARFADRVPLELVAAWERLVNAPRADLRRWWKAPGQPAFRVVVEGLQRAGWRDADMPPNVWHVVRAVQWHRAARRVARAPKPTKQRKAEQRQRDRNVVGYRCRACGRSGGPVEVNHFWAGVGKYRTVRTDAVRAMIRDNPGDGPPWRVDDGKGGQAWIEPLCRPCHRVQTAAQRRGAPWGARYDPVTGEAYDPEHDPDGSMLGRSLPAAAR